MNRTQLELVVSIPTKRIIHFLMFTGKTQFQIDKLPTKSPNVTISIIGSIGEGSNPTLR